MEVSFFIKYNIDDICYFTHKEKQIEGRIEMYRIIVDKHTVKIHYMLIVPEYEIEPGVSTNGIWVDEESINKIVI